MAQRIIAVYGPSGPYTFGAAAVSLGECIASSDILLTGGTGIPDRSVKEQALLGAQYSIRAGSAGRWIGVPQAGGRVASPPRERGFILRTPYRNERNYLNAFLCDSAIALRGGPGTDSEVAFCVVLGRPVVLLGPGWDDLALRLRRPDLAGQTAGTMIDRLFPLSASGDRPVDQAIRSCQDRSSTITQVRADLIPGLGHVDDAVAMAREAAGSVDRSELGDLIGSDEAGRFLGWLDAE